MFPLDPASHLHILCKYTIHVYSIRDLLGPGGTYFNIKISDDPMFLYMTRNAIALMHVSVIRSKLKLLYFNNTSYVWFSSKGFQPKQ